MSLFNIALDIDTNNGVLDAEQAPEILRRLEMIADSIRNGIMAGRILDGNGKTVSEFGYKLGSPVNIAPILAK